MIMVGLTLFVAGAVIFAWCVPWIIVGLLKATDMRRVRREARRSDRIAASQPQPADWLADLGNPPTSPDPQLIAAWIIVQGYADHDRYLNTNKLPGES